MDNDLDLLNVPLEKSVRYETNYIQTAVCELRFPTLLELESSPPIKFQSALRKLYPFYTELPDVSFDLGNTSTTRKKYLFESKKRDWAISLGANSISLETKKYTDFDDFNNHFTTMLNAIGDILDTDFFTRFGLRYINTVPLPGKNMDRKDIDKWINPVLVGSLKGGELGTLRTFNCELSGHIDGGGYTFRHGFASPVNPDKESLSYLLDYDYFRDGIEYQDVSAAMKQFSEQNFSLFMWSLGEKSIEALGKGKNK